MNETTPLIIFMKAPIAGQVKTRLVPPLSFESAAQLYRLWCVSIYRMAKSLAGFRVQVAYQPHPDLPSPQWLDREPVDFFIQEGRDLGSRMARAFERSFQNGARKTVLIGTDSPGLPERLLRQAQEALGDSDLVLGPSQDGGFYLVALRGGIPSDLFSGIAWSSDQVLRQTAERARRKGLQVHYLETFYDIDRPEDLRLLQGTRFLGKGPDQLEPLGTVQ